jgi:hypothetical protein
MSLLALSNMRTRMYIRCAAAAVACGSGKKEEKACFSLGYVLDPCLP